MENFKKIKERILKHCAVKGCSKYELQPIIDSNTWEELKVIIVDEFWWCFDDNTKELPDGHYKTSKYEFTIVDGKLEGEYKEWWSNGQLWEESFYKDGKLEGNCKRYYKNGQPHIHCTYKNGLSDGEFKSWRINGQLEEQSYFKNDKLEGERKLWLRNGMTVTL
jgi:hypothetical protein